MPAKNVTDLDIVLACKESERRLASCLGGGKPHSTGTLLLNFVENRKTAATIEDVELAMIRAWARGYIEVRTNLAWAGLTPLGRGLAEEPA